MNEKATVHPGYAPVQIQELGVALSAATADARLDHLERQVAALQAQLATAEANLPLNQATFCVLSGDYERVMAALMMANMAAAMEMQVNIYFSFWGIQAIRKSRRLAGKSVLEKALAAMLKPNIEKLTSSKFNFGGLGPVLFEHLMRRKNISTPAELLAQTGEARIRLMACTTSMEVFGITAEELLPEVCFCGAAEYLEAASRSKVSLFI